MTSTGDSAVNDVPQLTLEDAWRQLRDDPAAALIDVRTQAEWAFVGVPDLSSIGKDAQLIEWNQYPSGHNALFVRQVAEVHDDRDTPILLLCRSGARSQAAAEALRDAGFTATFNVVAGFEGDLDGEQHRRGGWKSHLPWKQS